MDALWNVYSKIFRALENVDDCEIEGDFNDGQHYIQVMNTLYCASRKTAIVHLVSSRGMLRTMDLS